MYVYVYAWGGFPRTAGSTRKPRPANIIIYSLNRRFSVFLEWCLIDGEGNFGAGDPPPTSCLRLCNWEMQAGRTGFLKNK